MRDRAGQEQTGEFWRALAVPGASGTRGSCAPACTGRHGKFCSRRHSSRTESAELVRSK